MLPVRRAILSVLAPAIALAASARAQCPAWSDVHGAPGFDGRVDAFALYDDGSGTGPLVYAAGAFTRADGRLTDHVARWNGGAWEPLAGGPDGEVRALQVFDDGNGAKLYAGGAFASAGGEPASGVARFDGARWSGAKSSFTGGVRALCVHDDGNGPALYAGGEFLKDANGVVRRVARFDGASWHEVGGGAGGTVNALCSIAGELFAGGAFQEAGGVPASSIARWDGVAWSALGAGCDAQVLALAAHDDGSGVSLWAAGSFTHAGGAPASHVAKWNGASWSAPADFGTEVRALVTMPWPGGERLLCAGAARNVFAKQNNAWNAMTSVLTDGDVDALLAWDDAGTMRVAVGGEFAHVGGLQSGRVSLLTPATSAHVPMGDGEGLDGSVLATVAFDDGTGARAVVAGTFLDAGDRQARGVARWDGAQWTPLGNGLITNNLASVRALCVHDDGTGTAKLYAAGRLDAVSPAPGCVARFDGAAWHLVGAGFNGIVRALCSYDDGRGPVLFAGGAFTFTGSTPMTHVAAFDGTVWQPVQGGIPSTVTAMCVYDAGSGPRLYVGTQNGGMYVWDGTQWSTLAIAPNGVVNALVVHDDGNGADLYAGGQFANVATNVARFDGASWTSVGTGLNDAVNGLAVLDDATGGGAQLFACGAFTGSGNRGLAHLARWNGTFWDEVDGGVDAAPSTMVAVRGTGAEPGELWLGGTFTSAGSVSARDVALWRACGPVSSFCSGDGNDPHVLTPCPCSNFGAPGRGCAWHANPLGALLASDGGTNPDTFVLLASDMPQTASAIFLKSDVLASTGATFGDGVRCVGGTLVRLGSKTAVAGAAQYPEPGNLSVSSRGNTPPGSGAIGYYQTYYRNAAPFCTGDTFNVTNALRVVW